MTYWLKVMLLVVLVMYVLGGILAFLARIESIAILLIASIFLAYLLYPAVRMLNRRLSLIVSILIIYGLLLILALLGVWFVLPVFAREIAQLVRAFTQAIASIQAQVENPASPILGISLDGCAITSQISHFISKPGRASIRTMQPCARCRS